MEAQKFEQVLGEHFRQEQEMLSALEAPTWFEHELRRSAFLAERAGASLCAAQSMAEFTDMTGELIEEDSLAISESSNINQPPAADQNIIIKSVQKPKKSKKQHGNYYQRFHTTKTWIGSLVAAAVVFIVVYFAWPEASNLPSSFAGEVSIIAAEEHAAGISMDKGFIISADQPLTDQLVQDALSISPEIDYTLSSSDNGSTYTITPEQPLESGIIYRLSFDPERYLEGLPQRASHTWAFQTETAFALTDSLPADLSTYVDVNTAIELAFSSDITVEDAKKAISIEPAVEGEWKVDGSLLTIIPAAPLAAATIYQLTISDQLTDVDGGKLSEERLIRFETQSEDTTYSENQFNVINDETNFSPNALPAVELNLWQENPPQLSVKLYGFADAESYAGALMERDNNYFWSAFSEKNILDTAELSLISEFSGLPQQKDGGSYDYQLVFPEKLASGFYLAELTGGEQVYQMLFSVSALSAYVTQGNDDCLFWVHNGNEVAEDAKISLYQGKLNGQTDQDGIAVLNYHPQAESRRTVFMVEDQDMDLVVSAYNYSVFYAEYYNTDSTFAYEYWHYLYTDRTLYKPGETVEIFGVVSAKKGAEEISEVELRLTGGNYLSGELALSSTCHVDNGVFNSQIQLPQLQEGWYGITVLADGKPIDYAYFTVADYQTASYKLTAKAKQTAVMVGDTIDWQIEAAYFDGTPAVGVGLTANYGGEGAKQLVTDENGFADFSTTAEISEYASGYILDNAWLEVNATLPEGGEVYASTGCNVFSSDVDVEGEISREGDNYRLKLQAFDISLDDLEQDEYGNLLVEKCHRDFNGKLQLAAKLIHCGYKQLTGSYYNEYTKQNEQYTYYEPYEETEETFTVELNNAEAKIFSGKLLTDDSYRLELSAVDKAGNSFNRSYYLWSGDMEYSYLWLDESDEDADNKYQSGETIELRMMDGANNNPLTPAADSSILYFTSMEKIEDYQVGESPIFKGKFIEKYIPNINITGVYFVDGCYREAYHYQACFDAAEYTANIEILPDKDQYQPGDTVVLDVNMSDIDGEPLEGYVNISVVDQALLNLSENYGNIVSELFNDYIPYNYSSVIYGSREENTDSSSSLAMEGGAGGDGGSFRENFSDLAVFSTVKTDTRGNALLEFQLPDDVTGWQVVCQGYADGPYVGYNTISLSSSLPFFCDVRLSDNYMVGDKPKIGLRAAGSDTDEQTMVTYNISIDSLNYHDAVQGQAYGWTELPLPQMAAGEYTMVVDAVSGGLQDAVRLSFKVSESLARHQVSQTMPLTSAIQFPKIDSGMVNLYFSDSSKAIALTTLYDFIYQQNIRLEQRLAGLFAADTLADTFGKEEFMLDQADRQEQLLRLSDYQQADGGLSILPYADSSLEVSALAVTLNNGYFDRAALSSYFMTFISDESISDADKAMAYMGLAALDQPVLDDINDMFMRDIDGLTQVYLTIALDNIGYGAAAAEQAVSLIDTYTEDLGGGLYRADTGSEDQLRDTAYLAMLANSFDLPQADGLFEYLNDNYPADEYYLLQRAVILKDRLQEIADAAAFSYTLDGNTVDIDLNSSYGYALTLTAEQLADLKIDKVSGDVAVTLLFEQDGLPSAGSADTGISFKRLYQNQEGDVKLPQDQQVPITLEYSIPADAPAGGYNIVDYLPAALRFVSIVVEDNWQNSAWLIDQQGQRLTFSVYKEADKAVTGSVTYMARLTGTGSYIADAPYMYLPGADQTLISRPAVTITVE